MTDVPKIGIADTKPDDELIAELESLLDAARSGKLRGIAVIGWEIEREVRWGLFGVEVRSNYLRTYAMLSWLAKITMERWEQKVDA